MKFFPTDHRNKTPLQVNSISPHQNWRIHWIPGADSATHWKLRGLFERSLISIKQASLSQPLWRQIKLTPETVSQMWGGSPAPEVPPVQHSESNGESNESKATSSKWASLQCRRDCNARRSFTFHLNANLGFNDNLGHLHFKPVHLPCLRVVFF